MVDLMPGDKKRVGGGTATLIPTAPYHMVWLATNACNAGCVHCSSNAQKRRPAELETEEALSLFEQLADFGVFDLAISGGEPLLRRDIIHLIEYATGLGLRVGIGSNGSTVSRRKAAELRNARLDRLQVSVDGLEPTHDLARRWPGLFRKAERAITNGLDADLNVTVCFTAHRLNHRELIPVIEKCLEWGVKRFNLSRFVPTGRGEWSLDLTPEEWKDITAVFDTAQVTHGDKIEFTTHLAQTILAHPELDCVPGFRGCQAAMGQGAIGPEGEVMPCVMLPIPTGNIRDGSLAEIWTQSPVLSALRSRDRLKGRCRSCPFVNKCGGCRAVAYSYTGDHLASDPRCWIPAVQTDR